jgi:hypothetical protein
MWPNEAISRYMGREDGEKPRKASVRLANVPVKIQTKSLPNRVSPLYHDA